MNHQSFHTPRLTGGLTAIGDFYHADLEDGHYTAFTMLRCRRCRKVVGFPEYNFNMAIADGTEETKRYSRSSETHTRG